MAGICVKQNSDIETTEISLENKNMIVNVIPSKGSDILSIIDKTSDSNILFETPHNWKLPGKYTPSVSTESDWLDYYPGGWQVCLPFGGQPVEIEGTELGLHGESALLEWDYMIPDSADENIEIVFECELVRYPFKLNRTLTLDETEPVLKIKTSITNLGATPLQYNWLEHICFGPPLIGPEAKLHIPDAKVTVEKESQGKSPLPAGKSFSWPIAPNGTDLSELPKLNSGIHDLSYLYDISGSNYEIHNPRSNLGVRLSFDQEFFESLWLWRSFAGVSGYPFFGRGNVLGVEPSTGWPGRELPDSQQSEGTGSINEIDPSERVETILHLELI